MNRTIESRKTEIRYVTSDPKKMLGKWVARRALRTWTEDFVEATCDNISKGNPDAEGKSDDKKETKKFYQIGAHVVLHDDKEGDIEEDHTFIVQTISAVRANMLIEKWLRDKQEERFRESLKHPERTFVKYQINSFIEESKIIPIGCFIPVNFSEVYNDRANDD